MVRLIMSGVLAVLASAIMQPVRAGDGSMGMASFYPGIRASFGEFTAAHRSLRFGTRVRVISVRSGRSVVVRINDRGPFSNGRVIDLSRPAATQLNMLSAGVTKVRLEVLGSSSHEPQLRSRRLGWSFKRVGHAEGGRQAPTTSKPYDAPLN